MDTSGVRQRRLGGGDAVSVADADATSQPVIDGTDGGFTILLKITACLLITPLLFLGVVDVLVPDIVQPEAFSLADPPRLEGPLAQNELLVAAERLHEGEVHGPESITVQHGHLYTGTADGKILHIHDGKIRLVTHLGKPPCGSFNDEPTCGRPLGMRFDGDGYLVVADAYLGLFRTNVTTGESEALFLSTTKVGGKEPMFLNDLDIASDGTIYISDSSFRWDRRHHPLAISENKPEGRLLKYDPSTGEMTVVLEGLHFANGVQLSSDEDYLLVAETAFSRILKYHLKGSRAGSTEVFTENLPGLPDNIRASSAGGFWVGIASHRSADHFSLFDWLSGWPSIRRVGAKILHVNTISKSAILPYGLILELDTRGHVVRSLHDPKAKTIGGVSEVEDVAGELYLGSFKAPYIGKLDLRKGSNSK